MAERVKLDVKLLTHTPEPELAIALGGRLCYSASHISELKERAAIEPEKFADKLLSSGHQSPIEHASFTFGAEGVSRALLAQITRHRIASFSVQSQRYVTQKELSYVLPPSIEALGEDAVREYAEQIETVMGFYRRWLELGAPAEDARFVLPNGAETRMVFTMNARELLHFFELRCCHRAQWEIRRLAWAMLGMVRRETGRLFEQAGCSCFKGPCPEGRMCCGRQAEMKRLSEELAALADSGATDEQIVDWVTENIV